MTAGTGIAAAMKFFGRLPGQTLSQFKDEWHELSPQSRVEISNGLADGTFTYPDPV